jgi:hypothetical protein
MTRFILESNWDRFQTCCALLDDTLQLFGAQMNKAKTEWLELEGFAALKDAAPLPGRKNLWVNGVAIPKTAVFRYLGSMLSIDDSLGVKMDICRRVSWPMRRSGNSATCGVVASCLFVSNENF